jgi:hypothetical protein
MMEGTVFKEGNRLRINDFGPSKGKANLQNIVVPGSTLLELRFPPFPQ